MKPSASYNGHSYGHRRKISTYMRSHVNPRDIRGMLRGIMDAVRGRVPRNARDLWNFTNALRVLWLLALLWYEIGVWSSAISGCGWERWEEWVSACDG